jgi:hypothetical protein
MWPVGGLAAEELLFQSTDSFYQLQRNDGEG